MFTYTVHDDEFHSYAGSGAYPTLAEARTAAIRNLDSEGDRATIKHLNEDGLWVEVDEEEFFCGLIEYGEYTPPEPGLTPFFRSIPYELTERGRKDTYRRNTHYEVIVK